MIVCARTCIHDKMHTRVTSYNIYIYIYVCIYVRTRIYNSYFMLIMHIYL